MDSAGTVRWRLLVAGLCLLVVAGCRATAERGMFADDTGEQSDTRDAPDTGDGPVDTGEVPDGAPRDTGDARSDTADTTGAEVGDSGLETAGDGADTAEADAGCPPGEHDGGDGTCVPEGMCASGYHDGGDGTCLPKHRCAPGYYLESMGSCAQISSGTTSVDSNLIVKYSIGGYKWIALWASDQLIALPGQYDLQTGNKIQQLQNNSEPRFYPADRRYSAWVDRGSDHTIVTWYHGIKGWDPSGMQRWGIGTGCCSYRFRQPTTIDVSLGIGYQNQRGGIRSFDLRSGYTLVKFGTNIGDDSHMCLDQRKLYVTGKKRITYHDISNRSTEWSKRILPTKQNLGQLGPCALAFDGSLVTSSPSGAVIQANPDGTSKWGGPVSVPSLKSTGVKPRVVIGPNDTVYATTGEPGIVALDLKTGSEQWTISSLPGMVHELVVGDRGYLYAMLPTEGEVRVYERSSGDYAFRYHNLPTKGAGKPTDLLLRDGVLFYNSAGKVRGIPVPSVDYPESAPWPVAYHDNQRTSDLNGPTHY